MAAVDAESARAPPASQKYDRQIRIWGEHGQAALERASVCLLNAGATGTETLKNLVLPGIGAFTIVDGAKVEAADVGSNFFIPAATRDASGAPINRAFAAAKCLLELNNDVEGGYVANDVSSFLTDAASAAAFFQKFSVVIATQMGTTQALLRTIATGCQAARTPLIVVRSYGLIGCIRIQIPEMCVLDARQDASPSDLRLQKPFPALVKFVDQFDLAAIEDTSTASHVPFVVILIKALSLFREKCGKEAPSSRPEKDEFSSIVKSLRPKVCPDHAENFEEALKYSNLRLCYSGASTVDENVEVVLSDPAADPAGPGPQCAAPAGNAAPATEVPSPISLSGRLNSNGTPCAVSCGMLEEERCSFWLHAAAVRAFRDANDGELPVAGTLPDMTADTTSYVELQRLYAAKADDDATHVLAFASKIAERWGATCRVDETTVKDFCKRLGGVRVRRYRSIEDEAKCKAGSDYLENVEMTGAAEPSNANSALSYYSLLRAVDRFQGEHGWFPGEREESLDDDLRLLRDCVSNVKSELGGPPVSSSSLWCDETYEMMRFANGELHNVASYLGGIAAQEAVKIVTRQFVPLNNTLMVNFANMTSASFQA
jgi:NEDD8-activating enzyme E1 regulatory subunit